MPSGSSPRVRGKRGDDPVNVALLRIIPARAGQTRSWRPRCWSCPDHPRACGANHLQRHRLLFALGSSPRVRGKRQRQREGRARLRIIPARAGQTSCSARQVPASPDHPRACGANSLSESVASDASGSSPRVRGKLRQPQHQHRQDRIIPARAGQTSSRWASPRTAPDHPRACGANVNVGQSGGQGVRIIPARAG